MATNSMKNLNDLSERETENKISTDKKMRIGIIGCGWIADAHIFSYLKQPDVEIVAGCDLVPGKAKAFFADRGCGGISDRRDA